MRMAHRGPDMTIWWDMTLQEEIDQLQDELLEAKLEIRRHHTDFEKVRTALDSYEADRWMEDKMLVKEIRNIVG